MNPALLFPAGLLALAALALPLLLHLARREESRPVDFAALRWLVTRLRPRRSVRFEEWLLLALRLLLLALLALLLARPVLYGSSTGAPWIVALPDVAPEVLLGAEPGPGARPDGPGGGEPVRRWLAPGFPAAGGAVPPAPGRFPSLLRELDMHMPEGAPLTVLVPAVLDGADAERPRLSRPVEWRVVGDPAAVSAGKAWLADAPSAGPVREPPRIAIRYAPERVDSARYLHATATAWRTHATRRPAGHAAGSTDAPAVDISAIDTPADAAAAIAAVDVVAWLAPGELPAPLVAWIEAGGTALVGHDTHIPVTGGEAAAWQDDEGRALLHAAALGRGRLFQWTRPLQPAALPALLEPDFPRRVADALALPPPPSRVRAVDYAPVVDAGVGPWPQSARELSPWLALAIVLLFALERWLAAGPRPERHA